MLVYILAIIRCPKAKSMYFSTGYWMLLLLCAEVVPFWLVQMRQQHGRKIFRLYSVTCMNFYLSSRCCIFFHAPEREFNTSNTGVKSFSRKRAWFAVESWDSYGPMLVWCAKKKKRLLQVFVYFSLYERKS